MSNKRKKSKPTKAYSSISIAIVLFLLGLFVIIFLHANDLTNILKEKIGIIVELKEDAGQEEALSVINSIKSINSVKQESIVLISKSTGLENMNKGLQIKIDESENPFLDVVRFNIKAENYSQSLIEQIITSLEKDNNVSQVFYEDASISHIKSNLNKLAFILLCIGLVFVLLAIVIIRNTINLSMYADRHEIKTMQLIGAKWNFIKMPYIKSSILIGVNGFIIACVLIGVMLVLSNLYVMEIWNILNFIYVLIALLAVLLISIIIPAIVTNQAANRFLNQSIYN